MYEFEKTINCKRMVSIKKSSKIPPDQNKCDSTESLHLVEVNMVLIDCNEIKMEDLLYYLYEKLS